MSAYVSVIGLLNWDENIIDNTFLDVFIALFKTETIAINMLERLEDLLVYECGELEVTLPNPIFFKKIVKSWADNQTGVWKAYYSAQQAVEVDVSNILLGSSQEVLTGKDGASSIRALERGGDTTLQHSGTGTVNTSVYGFNETTAKPKDNTDSTDDFTDTNNVNLTDNETFKNDVTRNQTKTFTDYGKFFDSASRLNMVAEMNVINKIVYDFRDRFCLSVY
jgi:hypothetical protein